jgi:mycothiol synthase
MDTSPYAVLQCPPGLRDMALRTLHRNVPEELQAGLVQAIETTGFKEEAAWGGLFICKTCDHVSVAWAQLLPGRSAALWPPAADVPTARQLLQEVGRFLDQRNVVVTQLMLGMPQKNADNLHQALIQLLTSSGYYWLSNLHYLVANNLSSSPTPPTLPIEFESHAAEQPQRLAQLIEQTYIGTCDCPAIDGIRSLPDVLASYQSTGSYQQELWYFVQHQGLDMGALLLSPHGDGEVWELVYMGIVPAARGHGFGGHIVQKALWQTARSGGQRLVLAVDESNEPALSMYHRANLVSWDRRQVYARIKAGKPFPSLQ